MSDEMEMGWITQLTGNQAAAREAVKARGWVEEDAEEHGYDKGTHPDIAVFSIPVDDEALVALFDEDRYTMEGDDWSLEIDIEWSLGADS